MVLVACAAVAATVSVSVAAASPAKRSPVKKATASLCALGQSATKAKPCRANPRFAKDVCASFVPQVQAFAGSEPVVPGPNRDPFHTSADCFFRVDGQLQAFSIHVYGGKGFHTNSLVDTSKQIGLAQAFWEQYQYWVDNPLTCPPPTVAALQQNIQPEQLPAKTTVGGYQAWTLDQCAQPEAGVPVSPNFGSRAYADVLTPDAIYEITAASPAVHAATSDLLRLAAQLTAKYH